MTYAQFLFLHKSADDQLYNQNRFLAGIHGIDLEETAGAVTREPKKAAASISQKTPVMFGDPEEYAHFSDQEKKALTQKMLNHWKPLGSKMLEPKKLVRHT